MKKEIQSLREYMEMVNAFRISRILMSAYELGIFGIIENNAATSQQIADDLQADPRGMDRFLNALSSIGVIQKKNNLFSNTPFASRYLVPGKPDFLGGIGHSAGLWHTWSSLTEAVRKGHSITGPGPIADRDIESLETFIAAMHTRGVPQSMEVAEMMDLSGIKRILDVGGGSGAFTFEFLKRIPGSTAIILDLPAVIPITEKYVEKSGFSKRISFIHGDYLDVDFGQHYDLVYLSAIIHINSPEENRLLVRKSAESLDKGGQLVIMDHIMSDDRTEPAMGAIFALNMLVGTKHGDTYTEKEIRGWMEEGGIKNIVKRTSENGTSILSGRKA